MKHFPTPQPYDPTKMDRIFFVKAYETKRTCMNRILHDCSVPTAMIQSTVFDIRHNRQEFSLVQQQHQALSKKS